MKFKYLFVAVSIITFSGIGVFSQFADNASGNQIKEGTVRIGPAAGETRQTYPPGIMFSTLLNNVRLVAKNGRFDLGNQMQNVFMPDGSTGQVVVSRADGSVFSKWQWGLDTFGQRPPYKLFSFKRPLEKGESKFSYYDLKLTEPGDYVVDFFLGAKKIYTFPFSVSSLKPANPFDGEPLYFLEGAWNDWGYLFYTELNPEQNLIWKMWLREKSHGRPDHKIRIEIVRDQDGKLICQSRENTTYNFQHEWKRYEFDMINPPVKTSGGAYFKAKDLLASDGGHTLTMKIDGEVYGKWKFTVTGGKLNYTGSTLRGEADPLTFVEGGKDAFWYKRES